VFDARSALHVAMERAARQLTPALKNSAKKHKWPREDADKLHLYVRRHIFSVDYVGSLERAKNLEFGTAAEPPKPAIHNFFEDHKTKKRMNGAMMDGLTEFEHELEKIFKAI